MPEVHEHCPNICSVQGGRAMPGLRSETKHFVLPKDDVNCIALRAKEHCFRPVAPFMSPLVLCDGVECAWR